MLYVAVIMLGTYHRTKVWLNGKIPQPRIHQTFSDDDNNGSSAPEKYATKTFLSHFSAIKHKYTHKHLHATHIQRCSVLSGSVIDCIIDSIMYYLQLRQSGQWTFFRRYIVIVVVIVIIIVVFAVVFVLCMYQTRKFHFHVFETHQQMFKL